MAVSHGVATLPANIDDPRFAADERTHWVDDDDPPRLDTLAEIVLGSLEELLLALVRRWHA